MKILVVSNLYPPHFIGGYELGCRDVVEGLRGRGHRVHVVTGDFRNANPAAESNAGETGVERILRYESQTTGGWRHHRSECRKFARVLGNFRPELIYFWNQGGLCPWLPLAARWQGYRIAFFLFDTNFVAWRVGAWLGRAARQIPFLRGMLGGSFLVKGWPVIRRQTCHFGSAFLRQTALEADTRFSEQSSVVIKWGIDFREFTAPSGVRERWPVRRLVYVGQISPLKGIHTAIAALGEMVSQNATDLHLTIVGGGTNPDYEEELAAQVDRLGLAAHVKFHGKVERSALAGIFAENDVLLFPSEWAEPFGITRLEAMAAGLAVIGTTTGGSGELLRHGETGLTFRAGDAADCARAIHEARGDRELFERVRANGQREVLTNYTLERMITNIESSLRELIARAPGKGERSVRR